MDKMNVLQLRIKKLKEDLDISSKNIMAQIALKQIELKDLEYALSVNESQIKDRIFQLENRFYLQKEIQDSKRKIKLLQNEVLQLFENNLFGEIYLSWNKLEHVFVGNRFCTYFWNREDCGFYSNDGEEGDLRTSLHYFRSLTFANLNNRCMTKEELSKVVDALPYDTTKFNNYAAYKIAGDKTMTDLEKFDALEKMFDNFLKPDF